MELWLAGVIAALLGGLGGVLHWVLPDEGVKQAWDSLWLRVFLGLIAGVLVGLVTLYPALNSADIVLMVSGAALVLGTGYAGLDVVMTLLKLRTVALNTPPVK